MDVQQIPIKKIKLGKNSRLNVTDEEIEGLMGSITEQGQLQAIGLRKERGGYQIAFGNRRFLAMSKLGKKTIAAHVVSENSTQPEVDMMNLAENVQRRNLSIIEIGRYVALLEEQDIKHGEVAIRLGVSKKYVRDCLTAFQRVPKEFQSKVASQAPGMKVKPGQIALGVVSKISAMGDRYKMNKRETKKLYKLSTSEDFDSNQIEKYAIAIKRNPTADPRKSVKKQIAVTLHYFMDRTEYDSLWDKYVADGPFRSMRGLGLAVLKGQKNVNFRSLK